MTNRITKTGDKNMNINVRITRSDKWLREQKIKTGENIFRIINVNVDLANLSVAARTRLVDWLGGFGDIGAITVNKDYMTVKPGGECYGHFEFIFDAESPTEADVDAAILNAFAELDLKRKEFLEHEAVKEQEQKEKEQERVKRVAELAKARDIIGDEIKRISDELTDSSDRAGAIYDIMSKIPLDSLRIALKKLNCSDKEFAEIASMLTKPRPRPSRVSKPAAK